MTDCGLRFPEKPRTVGLCGRAARISDCGPLSCAFIERVNRGRKSPKRDLAGRENPSPKAQFPFAGAGFTWTFRTSHTNAATFGSRDCGGTHATPAPNRAHSGLHGETRGVLDGGAITTLGAFRTFANLPGPGIRTAYFAAFWPWSGVLPKSAESLRDSDAHDARRCHEAPRPRWAA